MFSIILLPKMWRHLLLLSLGLLCLAHCGVSQRTVCSEIGDVIFVTDSSGSINDQDPQNWNRVKDFLVGVVDQLDIALNRTRVAMVKFSNKGNLVFNLLQYSSNDEVRRATMGMKFGGGRTNTTGGLLVVQKDVAQSEFGDRASAPNTIILTTDGRATLNVSALLPTATALKAAGNRIICIGITDNINMQELEMIASDPTTDVFTVQDFADLSNITSKLVSTHCVNISRPTQRCDNNVDLVMMLDASGSIESKYFNQMKEFSKSLVGDMDVESGKVRVGLLTFANDVEPAFDLGAHKNREGVFAAIDKVLYTRGKTNTADALKFGREVMFTPSRGARGGSVPKAVLLITDGNSNERSATLQQARLLKKAGVHVFVAIVGNWYDEQEMNAIASHPYEVNKLAVPRWSGLNDDFRVKMRGLICNNNNECDNRPCVNAMSCRDKMGYYWCQCSEGWGGRHCSDRCAEPADIVFALDASTSINGKNFEKAVNFLRAVIEGLRIGGPDSSKPTRVGLLTFANDARVIFHLNEYSTKYDILNAFPPHYTGGTTNTADALRTLRTQMFIPSRGDQRNARNIAVLLTDGRSSNEQKTWEEARLAREAGIDIISIGVGKSIRERELRAVASQPNTIAHNVLMAKNFDDLEALRARLTNSLCNNNNECSENPCRNGGRCEDGLNGYTCVCRDRYTGRQCERECGGMADVVFAVDTSGSIRQERFYLLQNFMRTIIDNLEVAQDKTRVAVVSWSDQAKVEFYLNTYKMKQDIEQAIEYIFFAGGRTNTAKVLEVITNDVFTPQRGDRNNVPNYVYAITDGNSNINKEETVAQAIAARTHGAHIITVSVGQQLGMLELKSMASQYPQDNMFSVESFDNLNSLMPVMPKAICDDVDECQSNPCRNGGRCINALKHYFCLCRADWAGYNCQHRCNRQLDVAFVLDLSGSVEAKFELALKFTREVIMNLDMNFGRVRVSLVTFGDDAVMHFNLNTYTNKQEVLNALTINPNRGRTNTQDALRMLRQDVFNTGSGDRSGVDNVAVLVTDGSSNIRHENTIPEARRVKDQDVALYVIGVGTPNMGEINSMAGKSNEASSNYVFRLPDESDVERVAEELALNRLCK